jgi:hypothetical protein
MRNNRLLSLLTAGAVGVIASLTVAMSPAAAAWGNCPDKAICLYKDSGGNGPMAVLSGDVRYAYNLTNVNFNNGQNANDQVSSIYNRSGQSYLQWTCAVLYLDINQQPASDTVWVHGSGQAIDVGNSRFNDKLSSLDFTVC